MVIVTRNGEPTGEKEMFQSLIGIIGYCNLILKTLDFNPANCSFQSLIGIIGYCNSVYDGDTIRVTDGQVSIPNRDYWLL